MGQLQKVLWTKGVLLSPQHLQAQDRFIEDLIGFHLSSLSFFPWGFSRLEIDREALAGGVLTIPVATGIFPDGSPFDIPHSDSAPPPKPLQTHWQADQESVDIYLAIPEQQIGGQNVSMAQSERHTRYRSEPLLLRDENTGLMEKQIQVARKNLRLLTGGESLDGNSTLRAARVRRTSAGVFELEPRLIPPLIDITASDYLLAIARRLVEILSAKSNTLSGTRRQRNRSLADFGVSDVANFWLLYTVNTHLPRFRHLFETARGHPSELYAAMLEVAGALTTFSPTVHPRDLPEYNHPDLELCFTRLDETLRALLETVVPTQHVTLPLRLTRNEVYATAIDNDGYFAAPQMFLAMNAEMRQDELMRKVPTLLKVSAANRMEHLIRQALPGVGLQHVPNPPSALPIKGNYQYFSIDRTGPDWDAVKANRNIAAYVPSDFPSPQLELVVMLPSDKHATG